MGSGGCSGLCSEELSMWPGSWEKGLWELSWWQTRSAVHALLNERWEVRAGKGFREALATCSFESGRLKEAEGPSPR